MFDRLLGAFRTPGEPDEWYTFTQLNGDAHAVHIGDSQLLSIADEHLAGVFLWHLNQRVMLETTSTLTIHAGVVSQGGRALIFPGDANAGKSTIVAALVQAGFRYLSDEAALIDLGSAIVHPYHRSLALEPGSWGLLPALRPRHRPGGFPPPRDVWLLPPDEIRPDCLGTSCAPAFVIFPQVAAGEGLSMRPVSRAESVRRLARRATNLRARGIPGFDALVRTVEASSCWEINLDGVEDAVRAIRALVTERGVD